MYMLNSTMIQRREEKCIKPLECINLVLRDRMNLCLDYTRLYSNKYYISGYKLA